MNRSRAVLSATSLSTSVDPSLSTTAVPKGSALLRLAQTERQFLILIGLAFFAAGAAFPYPDIARWLGFGLAAYSAIANDSIQTVGVFIASNKARPWWLLWLFIGGVFLVTAFYGWSTMDGDVSYGRLASKGSRGDHAPGCAWSAQVRREDSWPRQAMDFSPAPPSK